MIRSIAQIALVVSLWGPISVFAAGDPTNDPRGAQIEPVRLSEGDLAPYEGLLLPLDVAAAVAARAEGCNLRIETAREQERELGDVDLQLEEYLREADQERYEAELDLLRAELAEARPDWWEHPALWLGIGIVTAIAVTAGSVSILDHMRPIVVQTRPVTH